LTKPNPELFAMRMQVFKLFIALVTNDLSQSA